MIKNIAHHTLHILGLPVLWVALGLALKLLGADTGPQSRFAGLDWVLYAGLIAGMMAQARGWAGLCMKPMPAAMVFIALSVVCGMVYEASLTVDGTGMGGMHADTRTSFVLAVGDYLMLAVLCWYATRALHLDFRGLFFLSAGISLTEGMVFTGVIGMVLTSGQPLQLPLYLGYYFLAYAAFLAMPLVLLNAKSLWRKSAPVARFGPATLLALGFVLGMVSRIIWGLFYGPAVTQIFDLQPAVD